MNKRENNSVDTPSADKKAAREQAKRNAAKNARAIEDKRLRAEQKREQAEKSKLEKAKKKAAAALAKKEREFEKEKIRKERDRRAAARLKKRQAFYAKIKAKLKNRSEGFDYHNAGIVPRVEVIVHGDRASIAVRMAAAGITVNDMSFADGKTRFKIRKKDLRKAIAIFDEMCYTYKIGNTFGIVRGAVFWLSRAGLVIGAALSIACLNIVYGYVWRVQISGNDKLSAAAIESALKSAGIASGKRKSELSPERAVAALESMYGVADASCEIVGTTLYVRVLEAEDFTVHEKSGGYVSDYDATVTRIVMRSGTAAVKRGDVVCCGDVLASGDVYSTTGELLYTDDCDAEIYGDVAITFSADISRAAIEYKRTGKSTVKTVFGLFGHSFGRAKCKYASYETTAHTSRYDVLIPLYVTTYTFFETKPVEVERDIDEVAQAYAESKIEEMNFVGDFKYSYNVTQGVAGLYSVHLFLSGETLISRGVPRSELPLPPPSEQPQQ